MGGIDFSRKIGVFWVCAVLSACGPAGPEITGQPAAADRSGDLLLTQRGIDVDGAGLEIGFGRTLESTVPAVSKLVGRTPPVGQQPQVFPGCGTVMRWGSGLELTFVAGDFRGWALTGPTHQTRSGLKLGLPRSALEARGIAVTQTNRGAEFEAEGTFGEITGAGPAAKVTRLWAGTTCQG